MEKEYCEFAKRYNQCLRTGDLKQAIDALQEMAAIRRREGSDADEMKLLMLAFHISTSGCAGKPRIEAWIANAAQENIERSEGRRSSTNYGQMYLDIVRRDATPSHIMSAQDSWYLFKMVASGSIEDAERALQRLVVPSH